MQAFVDVLPEGIMKQVTQKIQDSEWSQALEHKSLYGRFFMWLWTSCYSAIIGRYISRKRNRI